MTLFKDVNWAGYGCIDLWYTIYFFQFLGLGYARRLQQHQQVYECLSQQL